MHLIKHFKKYESDPAVFTFSNAIVFIQIIFNIFNLYFEWTRDVFIFDVLSIQFFNIATFELASMFIPNTSSIVNEQLYYVDNYLFNAESKSI